MSQSAQRINVLVNDYFSGSITKGELDAAVNSVSYVNDSSIYVLYIDPKNLKDLQQNLDQDLQGMVTAEDLNAMINGSEVIRNKQYSRKYDTDVVFAGFPLRSSTAIFGAVIMFSPVNQLNSNITSINIIIWSVTGVSLLFAIFAIYLSSMRISKPIHNMEEASRKLARGEFTDDISVKYNDEIGKLADSFNFMKNELIKTEKIRREFIANVSHELRTPLTSINGFIKGMREGLVKQGDYDSVLEIVSNETQRLMKLTSEILELAKIQSGPILLECEIIRVKKLVDKVQTTVNPQLHSKQITFESQCDNDIILNCDCDRLTQILLNIVSNSIKYTDHGGNIRIIVDENDGYVFFKVTDNGIGIPGEELELIFDKFYQVNSSSKNKDGAGIGLNIVKALVELHGGTIKAESELGRGTTIIFSIPKR